jgi:tetratricopeptide (TPR) repeat protein
MLLGWLRYARKDAAGAARWFKASMGYGSLPKAIEGYALSLREQGQFAEAEKVSYENRKSDPLIAQLYIEILATDLTRNTLPTIDPARLSQFEAVVEEIKSANGSQALGWYYFRSGATQTAYDWFKRSVAWEVLEANTLGLALAAHKLNDRAAFKSAVTQYGPQFAAVASLSRMEIAAPAQSGRPRSSKARPHPGSPLANEAVALFHSGKYAEALAVLDKRAAIAKEDEGLQLLRGWTLYHTGQWTKAKDHFAAMDARNSTRETQYGKFYSNERLIAPQFRAD